MTLRLVSVLLLIAAFNYARGFEAYLQLDGIPGEATEQSHKDWIVLDAFQSTVGRPTGAARASFHLGISKRIDKSSPVLALRAANARPIRGGVIELLEESVHRQRFYQILVSNVVVSSVSASGDSSATYESVDFRFEWIFWTYTEMDHRGVPKNDIASYWDVVRNTGGIVNKSPFRLTGTKEGSNIAITWPGQAATTYRVLGSPLVTGPYNFIQNVTAPTNGTVKVSYPLGSGNLFYIVERP